MTSTSTFVPQIYPPHHPYCLNMNADDARTARKKRQTMFRKRKESLFGKAEELSEFTQVDVCLIVRHPQQGRFFTFAHINERFWPSGIVEAVSLFFKKYSNY